MDHQPVLIVGAGPTGLVLALWLSSMGIRVRIIDKTDVPGTTSRALAVQARTLELYQQQGLSERLIADGVQVAGANLWVNGARTARVPLTDFGRGLTPYPFALVYPQDAHERLLIERLQERGILVERQTELIQFEQLEDRVRAVLRRSDGVEEACQASFLLGCDGARSTVRDQLTIGFAGGTYSGVFYVADVEASGPVLDHELHIDLNQSDLLLVFPLKEPGRIRLVGNMSDENALAGQKFTFDDINSAAREQLKMVVTKVNWFSTYRVHHRVADHFRSRRAFLLGDAAHIHSPVGGQGMNTGIGDAINLAWKLATVIHGGPSRLLDTYELERIAFARRLVASTDRGFSLATSKGVWARFIRMHIVPVLVPCLFRIPPLRRFFFRTVSQIGISYRGSPLSMGGDGRIHGGDRVPWVQFQDAFGTQTDNYAHLSGRHWQIQCYGEMSPALKALCAERGLMHHCVPWHPACKRVGIQPRTTYVIRPDSYIGMVDPTQDITAISSYLDRWGITRSSSSRTA